MSREVELHSENETSFASVVPQQLCYGHCPCDCSAQQLCSIPVAMHWRGPHGLNTIVLVVVDVILDLSKSECAVKPLAVPPAHSPCLSQISHLTSVDVKQHVHLLYSPQMPGMIRTGDENEPLSFLVAPLQVKSVREG